MIRLFFGVVVFFIFISCWVLLVEILVVVVMSFVVVWKLCCFVRFLVLSLGCDLCVMFVVMLMCMEFRCCCSRLIVLMIVMSCLCERLLVLLVLV